jgi:hypothetical protein
MQEEQENSDGENESNEKTWELYIRTRNVDN